MRLWSKYVDDVCLPAVLVQNWSRVMRPVAENWTDAELEAHLKNIPTQERRDIWRRMARQPYTAAELAASMDKLRDMIRRGEAALRPRPWQIGRAWCRDSACHVGLVSVGGVLFKKKKTTKQIKY